ncbi:MAG: 4Fe-4S dicluster domain-containing protein [Methanomassiliicoccales archaeon]
MKKSSYDTALERELHDSLSHINLRKCHQCGHCTGVCPSARYGGIRPREIMERASKGTMDLRLEQDIWKCLMCNSCSERCQVGADPAHVITLLRNAAAIRGNRPPHFEEEMKLFVKTGMSFPRTGLTKKLRSEFSLPELEVDEKVMEELKILLSLSRLGRF